MALISEPRVHGPEINAPVCQKNICRVDFCQGVSAGFVFQVLRKFKSRRLYTESASPLCVLCGLSEVEMSLISAILDASALAHSVKNENPDLHWTSQERSAIMRTDINKWSYFDLKNNVGKI